ncbi:hypothetical protein LJR164_001586 [Phenylobacterium sp. LjRoot164]|uniref:hypothetical protein n=1 Tax=unclassified Phenylobacterium TaxID=2640670 RepID=UPI003ECDFD78
MTQQKSEAMEHGELIARLEAASEGSRELDALLWIATDPKPLGNIKHWVHEWAPGWMLGDVEGFIYMRDHPTGAGWPAPEFTTSLDAIVALIERKFPQAQRDTFTRHGSNAVRWWHGDGWEMSGAKTMPLALCIALLTALRTQDQGDGRG